MTRRSDKPLMHELLGDESARGIELAVTPVVFGGVGWLLDGWLGTAPWLTIGLAAFALIGTVAKMWFGYDAEMRVHETTSRWARRDGDHPATDTAVDVDLWSDRKTSQA